MKDVGREMDEQVNCLKLCVAETLDKALQPDNSCSGLRRKGRDRLSPWMGRMKAYPELKSICLCNVLILKHMHT